MVSILEPLGIIVLSGAIGGIVNAIMTDNGFILPREETSSKASIIIPGFVANILIGAIAGFIYWGLTDTNSVYIIYGPEPTGDQIQITVYAITMSLLVGAAGAKYLTNELDKRLLKAAAVAAAASDASIETSQKIASASPIQAFRIARDMVAPIKTNDCYRKS
jgi:hypothetical protein